MNNMKTILLSVLLGIGLTVSAQNHLGSVDTANFDANVSAKTDFYRHVNNGWLQKHPYRPNAAVLASLTCLTTRRTPASKT